MFNYCLNLASLDLRSFDTSNVTSMYNMFSDCYKLTSLDLRSFDFRNVDDISCMFKNCTSLSVINVSREKWDMEKLMQNHDVFKDCGVSEVTYV